MVTEQGILDKPTTTRTWFGESPQPKRSIRELHHKMKTFGTPAKISRPWSDGVLPRERLFERLDNSLKHPILWITGPPGAGKTSLVTSWLEARRMRSLWFQ